MKKKVILGFSGGLDTSYCTLWLKEKGYTPVCVCIDVGQDQDQNAVRRVASELKIDNLKVVQGQETFADLFVAPALRANALYQGVYPLATALSRPYIGKVLVDIAKEEGTTLIAHGCTGKGNDQVRLETTIRSLMPDAQIIDPIREQNLSRNEEMEYLAARNIKIAVTEEKPFSIDQNIWGRSICAGILEDLSVEVPENAYEWTSSPENAPDHAEVVSLQFEEGLPVAVNGVTKTFLEIVLEMNNVAGKHGIGRIDHIEDRLIGIKSRELYEAPGATALITAHQHLERLTLARSSLSFKALLETEYANLIYAGNWFSHHHIDLLAYLNQNQKPVSGEIKLRFYKGNYSVLSRTSENSLYDYKMITYGNESMFNQADGEAFSRMMGMESRIQAKRQMLNYENVIKKLV